MRVLVVEDNAEMVEFITIAFEIGWPGIELFSSHQAIGVPELVEKESPDVVLLDIALPDGNGFDVLKQIRQFSMVPVVIVTVKDTEADIVKGLDWGADEYIIKPFGQLELLARIKAVLRSRLYANGTDTPMTIGRMRLNVSTGELISGSQKIYLTRTEANILNLLMKQLGQVVTHTELSDVIWGDTYPHANEALRVYIRRIRKKLTVAPECSVSIHSRPGVGYVLEQQQ